MHASELKTRLGRAVRDRRRHLRLSQEELGGRAGLHRTYVADVERGSRNPSLETIGKLAQALQVSITALLSRADETAAAGVTRVERETDPRAVEILLVEDNPDDVALTMAAFEQAKLRNRLRVIPDGEGALGYLLGGREGWAPEPPPRLILLDLGLPGISGLEVLRRLKDDDRTREIPVIVLTGSRAESDVIRSRRTEVEHYILKPVDFTRFRRVTMRLDLQWALFQSAPAPPGELTGAAAPRAGARRGSLLTLDGGLSGS